MQERGGHQSQPGEVGDGGPLKLGAVRVWSARDGCGLGGGCGLVARCTCDGQQVQKGKSKTLTKTETATEIATATETETVAEAGTEAEDGTETCISAFHFAAVGAARDASLHRERHGAAVEDQLVSGQYEALSLPLHRQKQQQ